MSGRAVILRRLCDEPKACKVHNLPQRQEGAWELIAHEHVYLLPRERFFTALRFVQNDSWGETEPVCHSEESATKNLAGWQEGARET